MENQKNNGNLKNFWQTILGVSGIIFETFLIVYLALFLVDEVTLGFVSNFFNTNYILIICIIFGALTAFAQKEPLDIETEKTPQPLKKSDYFLMAGLGILAIVVVFFKIKEIGLALAMPISILSGILIFLISWLFLNNGDEKEEI